MNEDKTEPTRPIRNITWQTQPIPAECEHRYEVIAVEGDFALRRCMKCGSLEEK